ncbi:MAG: sulfatase-like hydrolase/transferase [Bacteroidota bacterium]
MKFHLSYKNTIEYLSLLIALTIMFCLLWIFDISMSNYNLQFFYLLVNDVWFALLIGLLFFPVYLLLNAINKKLAIIVIKVLFIIIVLIQLALIQYNHTTHLNLGADLLGYSLSDIYLTVSASASLSVLTFLPFVLLPLAYLGLYFVVKKLVSKNPKTTAFSLFASLIALSLLRSFIAELSKHDSQNKIYYLISDIGRIQEDDSEINVDNITYKKEYPLMKPFQDPDVLGPFFTIDNQRPNIVIIIVEGLGSEFIGTNEYAGFTPYLDSLIPKSLYWENFVSNTGRTFGVLPSLLGSLPFGKEGFLELDPLPTHTSLISILKSNGYSTSYYSGDDSNFDRRINFLEYNGIDNVLDINKFGPGYTKTKENSGGFSWGYPDAEIFRKTLSGLNGIKKPRLDIIMTLTTHEPFDFPSKKNYLTKVDSVFNSKPSAFKVMRDYKDIAACLLYADNSIKNFMQAYAKRPDYNNTIFFITGDHRLIPIPQKDKLCRFHVPLYIYSPMLKQPAVFKSVSSHWNVAPSIVSFLMNNYNLNPSIQTAWMSSSLDTARQFRNIHQIPMMRAKGSITDYIFKDYLYSDGELFKIKKNFETKKLSNRKVTKAILDSLHEFKKINAYLTKKNKIYFDNGKIVTHPQIKFSKEELLFIEKETKGLNMDQVYSKARDFALNNEHEKALLLCNYILNEKPNFADTQILKGRVLAWDKNYEKSEKELLDAIKRSPFYYDGYSALMDVYKWSDQDTKAIAIGKKALGNKIINEEIGFKLAGLYKKTANLSKASKTIDSLLKIYPKNTEYLTFKNSLKR